MTPENYSDYVGQKFNLLEARLKELQACYLNLFPIVKNKLSKIPFRQLWANPADGHPGDKLTDIYAEYIYKYLLEHKDKYFSKM